jgi:hypothetical protein
MHTSCDDVDDDSDLIDEDPPPSTQRTAGSATLELTDECTPLFISATWRLKITVSDNNGSVVVASSSVSDRPHNEAYKNRWARAYVRQNQLKLRKMGVDVEKAYKDLGGSLDDLDD